MNLGSQEKVELVLVGQIFQMKLKKKTKLSIQAYPQEMLRGQMELAQQFITKLLQHPLQKTVKM